jgi:dimethylaniline monooxygenase (N-oxide forming)
MIAATGYDLDLPFLISEQSPVNGRWLDLFQRVLRPGPPGLCFMGFFNVAGGGNIRIMDDQAEWTASLEAGEIDAPSVEEMNLGIAQERAFISTRYPDSPRYGLELDPGVYRKSLEKAERARRAPSRTPNRAMSSATIQPRRRAS